MGDWPNTRSRWEFTKKFMVCIFSLIKFNQKIKKLSLDNYLLLYGSDEHISIATTLNNMAVTQQLLGNLEDAKIIYRKVKGKNFFFMCLMIIYLLAIMLKIYKNKDNLGVATVIFNLACIDRDLSLFSKALEKFEQAYS